MFIPSVANTANSYASTRDPYIFYHQFAELINLISKLAVVALGALSIVLFYKYAPNFTAIAMYGVVSIAAVVFGTIFFIYRK